MSEDDLARLEAIVRGRVQGVGFRWFVIDRASYLGLSGWVANEQDGGVRCVVEGPRKDLLTLLEALHEGPVSSIVERVHAEWLPWTGAFGSFGIRSGGHSGD